MTKPMRDAGFTLLEVLLVVLILGMLSSAVVGGYQSWVPEAKLDAAASELSRFIIEGRTDAGLRSEQIWLELDLERNRYQYVFPPERRVSFDDPDGEEIKDGWTDLEEGVIITGVHTVGGDTLREERVRIQIDRNGFAPNTDIFLMLDDDDQLVWTLQMRGLENRCEIVKDFNGREEFQEQVEEFAFR
ncbi:MAG: prepilin-type N-terminal cleavage/methylation domain-containing protein [Planctomycetota bacterium]